MEIDMLLKGFTVGVVMAVPLGPVGLLCTQRILTSGRMHGLVSGLGAATGDAICGAVAAFGLTIVSDFLVEQHLWLRLFGGIFLCLLGLKAFLVKRAKKGPLTEKLCHLNNYGSTLLITLSNPMAFLVSATMFAGLGTVGSDTQFGDASQLVAGVFLGSMFWWVLLSVLVGALHKNVADRTLVLLARIFGGIITTIGTIVIISTVV